MAYIGLVCIADEMKAIAQGKTTKKAKQLGIEMVVYLSLDHHPAIQKEVAKAFGITC